MYLPPIKGTRNSYWVDAVFHGWFCFCFYSQLGVVGWMQHTQVPGLFLLTIGTMRQCIVGIWFESGNVWWYNCRFFFHDFIRHECSGYTSCWWSRNPGFTSWGWYFSPTIYQDFFLLTFVYIQNGVEFFGGDFWTTLGSTLGSVALGQAPSVKAMDWRL